MELQLAAALSAVGLGGSMLLWYLGAHLPALPRRRARDAEWVPVGAFPLERNLVLAAMLTKKDAVGPIVASLAIRGFVAVELLEERHVRVHRRTQPPDGFEREFFSAFFYDADVVDFRRGGVAEPRMAAFLRAQLALLRARRYWGRGSVWPHVARVGVPTLGLFGVVMAFVASVLQDRTVGADAMAWMSGAEMLIAVHYVWVMWFPVTWGRGDFARERLLHAGVDTVAALERFIDWIRAGAVSGRRPTDRVADAVEGRTVPDRLIPYLLMFDVAFDTGDPERMRRFRALAELAERQYGPIERL